MEPGYIHDVLLSNLKPNTEYVYRSVFNVMISLIYYRFGNKHKMSQEFSFKTRNPPASGNGINIVAFGDMGTYQCEVPFFPIVFDDQRAN